MEASSAKRLLGAAILGTDIVRPRALITTARSVVRQQTAKNHLAHQWTVAKKKDGYNESHTDSGAQTSFTRSAKEQQSVTSALMVTIAPTIVSAKRAPDLTSLNQATIAPQTLFKPLSSARSRNQVGDYTD